LPRVEIVVISTTGLPLGPGELHRLGETRASGWTSCGQFRGSCTRRPEYAAGVAEDGVVKAPRPRDYSKAGLPKDSHLAQVLVSKYADHLPGLLRQAQIYARHVSRLDRFHAGDWSATLPWHCCRCRSGSLGEAFEQRPGLFADETTGVLDHGRGVHQDRASLGRCR